MPNLLRLNVACSSYDQVVEKCLTWAHQKESHCLTFSAVHMVMEAHDKPDYRAKLNSLDMVNPDGMPVVWALRMLGYKSATRVYGPDATVCLLKVAAKEGIPVGFYGGSESTLRQLVEHVEKSYPGIHIAYAFSPPFRKLTCGRRCGCRGGDQCLGRALYLCRPRLPEAGGMDDRSSRSYSRSAAGGGRGVRFSGQHQAAGAALDDAQRTGVGIPAGLRAAPAFRAIFQAQSALRCAGSAPMDGHAKTRGGQLILNTSTPSSTHWGRRTAVLFWLGRDQVPAPWACASRRASCRRGSPSAPRRQRA